MTPALPSSRFFCFPFSLGVDFETCTVNENAFLVLILKHAQLTKMHSKGLFKVTLARAL
jgi:hypothetical protein